MTRHRAICTILFLLIISTSMIAQYKLSNGRAPVNKQRIKLNYENNYAQSVFTGNTAYGWSSWNFKIVSLPIPAGNPISNITGWEPPNGDFASSGVRGGDGNYYVVCIGPPSSLWQMDPGTGEMAQIGPISGLGIETVNGITYNPVNDKYYLAAGDYMVTNNLYSFDIHTLTATLIASFPNTTGIMVDIAIDSSGKGYGYDLTNDSAYTFNPVTGLTTPLGPLGFDCNYGQGMDIDLATNTIYLASYNNTTHTGQLRILNPVTGEATLVVDWGEEQISTFAINNSYVVPGPGSAANPTPPQKATNIDINAQLYWSNPSGSESINVMFGASPGDMSLIYSGAPVTTANPGTMSYYTQYYWRVDETNQSGTTYGPLWSFKTKVGPNVAFHDSFDSLANWHFAGPFGSDNWLISSTNLAGGAASPELHLTWYPPFNGASYLMSDPITVTTGHNCELKFTNYFEIWDPSVGNIGVAVTTDGGTTFTTVYDTIPIGTYGPEVQTVNFTGSNGMQIAFYYNGNSTAFTTWAIDDLLLTDLNYVPVGIFEDNQNFPSVYSLGQNFPNPFNPATKINYSLKVNSKIILKVFNILGQEVATLVNGNIKAGNHSVTFDASNLNSGVYLYKFEAAGADGSTFTSIKKMIFLK